MKTLMLLLSLSAIALASVATAAEQLFNVTGIIRGHLEDGQIVIQHDEIPGYMPAMTMAFALGNPGDAARLKNGDRVRFRYRVREDKSSAEDFVITGREAPVAQSKNATTKSARLRADDAVPEFALVNERDQPLSIASLRGKLTVVTFVFTRCPVPEYCPAMALRFGHLQKAILADEQLTARARLLSITLDPEFDRPDILKAYGRAVGANPSIWSFATGTKEQIAALTKAFAVYHERNGVTLDHTLCTALIGTDGRVVEIWRGHGWRTEEIVEALNKKAAKTAVSPCCPGQ
jgi:protein SCO1